MEGLFADMLLNALQYQVNDMDKTTDAEEV